MYLAALKRYQPTKNGVSSASVHNKSRLFCFTMQSVAISHFTEAERQHFIQSKRSILISQSTMLQFFDVYSGCTLRV